MATPKSGLTHKYKLEHRFANFGSSIRAMTINGFRGIDGLEVQFNYPVVAISGLNGAGKSTLGQICLSGYRQPSDAPKSYKRFYVRDFFPASAADPNPFKADASIVFHYETPDVNAPQELTVKRNQKEWSGYKRQPKRHCYYIGFTVYIPKVERKDLSIYKGSSFALTERRDIPDETKIKVGRILGQQYEELHFQGIRHGKHQAELGIAARFGASYSENNMGFGEGRTFYIVDLLESAPDNSLFVIEEPETSLHEHAEYELVKYLLDVCDRKGHQIVFTTHSDTMLSALPPEGRILLHRNFDGVKSYEGLSSTRARSIFTLGAVKSLAIFVEDEFAVDMLTKMLRNSAPELLAAVFIEKIGDTKAVRNALKLMDQIKKPCIAVRDADKGAAEGERLYSFPGQLAPEKEVYNNGAVLSYLEHTYGLDVHNVLALRGVTNHHGYTKCLANEISMHPIVLRDEVIRIYLDNIGAESYKHIIDAVKANT